MGTIIDYLKEYGDCSFADMPMNDVDSLILCQLSYLKFDKVVPDAQGENGGVSLEEIAGHVSVDTLFADVRYERQNRALFEAMLAGRRYRSLRLSFYVNLIEKEWETQFCAVTFLLEDGTHYAAFRGTDETIIGWKEDFNMAFLSPVPGQAHSVEYLERVMEACGGIFCVGGHSKGGNLAVYSAMNCAPNLQERIRKVYSMDGPGFRPEVLQKCRYDQIAGKVVKILPHSSLVGMLFEREIQYEVVESKNFGLAQHDPYSWLVEGRHFIKVRDVYEISKKWDNTLNEWILSLDEAQLRTFVDTLFQVIYASEAEDLIAFTADWKKSVNGVIAAMREVDSETQQMLKQTVKALFEIAKLHLKEDMAAGLSIKERHILPKKSDGEKPISRRRTVPKEVLPTE
ncbi:MAG: DUF2974 domain-containing protein [Candidatus Gastranaerophilales bacterium]|nr:DUF2974 domain-containing protein [Candidatus Gastranaerophilales bacterium]